MVQICLPLLQVRNIFEGISSQLLRGACSRSWQTFSLCAKLGVKLLLVRLRTWSINVIAQKSQNFVPLLEFHICNVLGNMKST